MSVVIRIASETAITTTGITLIVYISVSVEGVSWYELSIVKMN